MSPWRDEPQPKYVPSFQVADGDVDGAGAGAAGSGGGGGAGATITGAATGTPTFCSAGAGVISWGAGVSADRTGAAGCGATSDGGRTGAAAGCTVRNSAIGAVCCGAPEGAGLRSAVCASNRFAAARVRVYPAVYTARTAAELMATRLLAIFFAPCDISINCTDKESDFARPEYAGKMRWIPVAACLLANVCFAAHPVIFDTDMGNDIDDALALAMLHALTDRGECELIGVTLTNAHPAAVPYLRMINRFYGRGDLPVGAAIKQLKEGAGDGYMAAALRTSPAGSDLPAEPAPALLRRLLMNAHEKVIIVQTGFSTNLAALLDYPDGAALARDKVELVVAMAGNFTGGQPEYNVRIDVPSAKTVFEHWPTRIVFSGYEIGRDLLYPASSVEHDFAYAQPHPIADSYRAYQKMPYNRPTWDLTAVLEAVRGDRGYFGRSAAGSVTVEANGVTRFASGGGDRQYLRLDASNRAAILEALTLLASQPPKESKRP
jgi:inosine-uridine nucleoside N-ribohydrolase